MHRIRMTLLSITASLVLTNPVSAAPPASQPDRFVLPTRKVKLKRSEMTFLGLFPSSRNVTYHKAADITVDGEKQSIYIPKADRYTTKNTAKDDHSLSNKSTRLFVDANGDGKLDEHEGWFTNLPIRIADRNYRVDRIADDASQIEMTLLDAPLTGLVVGRPLPPFKLTTADGKIVTQDDYKGRAFLLDIWSVT